MAARDEDGPQSPLAELLQGELARDDGYSRTSTISFRSSPSSLGPVAAWVSSRASSAPSPPVLSKVMSPQEAGAGSPGFAARLPMLRLPRPSEGGSSISATAPPALGSSGACSSHSSLFGSSSRESLSSSSSRGSLQPCASRRRLLLEPVSEDGTAAAATDALLPTSPFGITTSSRTAPRLPGLLSSEPGAPAELRPPTPRDSGWVPLPAQPLRPSQLQPAMAWMGRRKTVSFDTRAPAAITPPSSSPSSSLRGMGWPRALALSHLAQQHGGSSSMSLHGGSQQQVSVAAARNSVAATRSEPGRPTGDAAVAGVQRFEESEGEAVEEEEDGEEDEGEEDEEEEERGQNGADRSMGGVAAAPGAVNDQHDGGDEDDDGVCIEFASSVARRRYQRVDSLAAALARMRRRNTPGSEGWPQRRQELKMRLLTLRREGDPLGVVETLRDVRKLPFPARIGTSWLN
ncbi:hypothetical protein CHLRE_01g033750v5 [Chlamydomonas reinhardtii]|uniref:Uncharacterized protein n=1 Tax=Chlamydomonas reinhardtii TaxID=3055 RepID=A0A2K3E6W9_CHLRE|nr:uncharacterized protein CHLRE_01g033750v5 [Chlamydomonas reinhardtii]PNW88538.1 hypothetical protein CHLRE_01g033750v5 [Chlamydomonas reinhardtii]